MWGFIPKATLDAAVAVEEDADANFWCPRCDVLGHGRECWACGQTDGLVKGHGAWQQGKVAAGAVVAGGPEAARTQDRDRVSM